MRRAKEKSECPCRENEIWMLKIAVTLDQQTLMMCVNCSIHVLSLIRTGSHEICSGIKLCIYIYG